MTKTTVTLLLIFGISSLLFAQTERNLTLQQAIDFAITNNYASQQSVLEIESSERKVKETIGIGLPQINGAVNFQHNLDISTTVLPDFISPTIYSVLEDEDLIDEGSAPQPGLVPAQFGTDYNAGAGLTLNQLIFDGSYLIGLKATKAFVDMSKRQHEKTEAEVREAVTNAYVLALISEENVALLNENISTIRNLLTETEFLYKEGFVEEQDVDQLQLTLSGIENNLSNAGRQKELSINLLKFQMGMPITEELGLSDSLDTLLTNANNQALEKTLSVENHPDYKVADANLTLKNLSLRNERAAYLPKLYGFFQHQQSAQRTNFDLFDSDGEWFPSTAWGLNLNLPIFSGGIRSNLVQQRKIDVQQAELFKEQVTQATLLENATARSDYLFALENHQTKRKELDLAEKIKGKTEIKYKEGISSSFELNQIQNQYLHSQGNYIQSRMQLLKAKVALDKALNNYEK